MHLVKKFFPGLLTTSRNINIFFSYLPKNDKCFAILQSKLLSRQIILLIYGTHFDYVGISFFISFSALFF